MQVGTFNQEKALAGAFSVIEKFLRKFVALASSTFYLTHDG